MNVRVQGDSSANGIQCQLDLSEAELSAVDFREAKFRAIDFSAPDLRAEAAFALDLILRCGPLHEIRIS